MSIVLGRGQCGAHITLLFTIDDSSEDLVYQGSRGAGICLKDGVEAIAKGDNGSGEIIVRFKDCLLYTSPSPRDQRGSRMPSSA